MSQFPNGLAKAPIAHRALHDIAAQRPENSISAVRAAIRAGYGIEIDVQLSSDGQAVVFHDYFLQRLTRETGPVRQRSAADLGSITLRGGESGETIPTLAQVLSEVSGQVPVLIELKDQDGALGSETGILEQAVANVLRGYAGAVAIMSFNPHALIEMKRHAPDVARGLTTGAFSADEWGLVPAETRAHLRDIPDFDRVGACFISHQVCDLQRPRVAALRKLGVPVLCWTVRHVKTERWARQYCDNITFENYRPDLGWHST